MVDATKQLHGRSQGLSFDSYQIPRSLWIPPKLKSSLKNWQSWTFRKVL